MLTRQIDALHSSNKMSAEEHLGAGKLLPNTLAQLGDSKSNLNQSPSGELVALAKKSGQDDYLLDELQAALESVESGQCPSFCAFVLLDCDCVLTSNLATLCTYRRGYHEAPDPS